MKIKELELRSGMDRANIRYYEKEGLLQPERTENGYREYSERDLQQLLKIRLLRSLHFSLDDIRFLIQNRVPLSALLKKQLQQLEDETEDLIYAKSLCESMQLEGATFQTLDAEKYLKNIESISENSSTDYFSIDLEIPQVFEPIRRFVARGIDFALYNTVAIFMKFLLIGDYVLENNLWTLVETNFTVLLMTMLLEPLLLRLFKRTFGKWIMGLSVEALDGSPLSYEEAFKRTFSVITRGMGLLIPLADLVCLGNSYNKLKNTELLSWDRGLAYRIKDRKIYRYILAFVLFSLISISVQVIPFLKNSPPNTGQLTVQEFSENFRHYQNLLEMDFGDYRLNDSGTWVEKEYDARLNYLPETFKYPQFRFGLKDRQVQEVNFTVTFHNNPFWVENYRDVMILASLALMNADDSLTLWDRLQNTEEIYARFYQNYFESDSFDKGGYAVSTMIEYDGYDSSIDILAPMNRERVNFFHQEFSIEMTSP